MTKNLKLMTIRTKPRVKKSKISPKMRKMMRVRKKRMTLRTSELRVRIALISQI